ncbi:MAG: restriction endonuclease [Deltaproteobacteria bacterium]|nr:restriction endonuclease [Deltaproteobacteria bacterium]
MAAKKKTSTNVRGRIRNFLIKNVGKVVSREQIRQAAKDPDTGKIPENWHQRLSELRCDEGYDVLSWRDRETLKPGQYVLLSATPKRVPKPRKYLSAEEKIQLFERDDHKCQWPGCGLGAGATDPVGGGTIVLTADHRSPHSLPDGQWTGTLDDWQTLCARHQQEKKNFIDDRTGRKNLRELVRAAGKEEKRLIFDDLKAYFGSK